MCLVAMPLVFDSAACCTAALKRPLDSRRLTIKAAKLESMIWTGYFVSLIEHSDDGGLAYVDVFGDVFE